MGIFGNDLPGLVAANLDDPPLYRQGDVLGLVLAYVSLAPAFHVFYRGSLLYHDRDWRQLENCVGVFANAVLSKVLKATFKIQRPASTCEQLGLCHEMGMPSTHSQIMSFAFFSMLMQLGAADLGASPLGKLEIAACAGLVAAVAWSRVYLGYHDIAQISAGLAVGVVAAVAWQQAVQRGIVRKPLQRILNQLQHGCRLRVD